MQTDAAIQMKSPNLFFIPTLYYRRCTPFTRTIAERHTKPAAAILRVGVMFGHPSFLVYAEG